MLALVTGLVAATPAISSPVSDKQAEAQRVLAQIREIDSSLDKAVDAYNAAQMRLDAIHAEQQENERHLRIARASYKSAQHALSQRLVALYQAGGDDTVLEVVLGSQSLGDLLDRIDTVSRVSAQDVSLVHEIASARREIQERKAKLERARTEQEQVVADRAAQRSRIQSQLSERQRLLSSIKSQIQRLEAQEAARQKRLQEEAQQRLEQQQEQAQQAQSSAGSSSASTSPAADGASVSSDPPPPSNGGVVGIAMQYLGTPYVWGGAAPGGFDCSGFVMYVYSKVGISLPHNAAMQYGYGTPVSRDQLAPGDLVFFDGLGHVGIYIGGNQFIHAPHTGDVVKISPMTGWYASTYVGARRL